MSTLNSTATPSHSRIQTLLIANRGEIACRVIASARQMGISTVAIYSEADANAMHVAAADQAVLVGPALVSESYLNIDAVIAAAKQTGANAIHPGYGFLSENPEFVEACNEAGIVFVGPSASAMRSMGLKDAAKALMETAGVPVVPGYHGDNQDATFLDQQAAKIGYPVLIKARAGGGGKGMRKVDSAHTFLQDLEAAQREGKASFGDAAVLIEKYIEQPRHIEVQIFSDSHGNTVHLFERDCSLQRRHQKVIEEAPAPGISDQFRDAITEAAIRTAESINYVGAGTVEFIVDASGPLRDDGFWFMEMNTRLQVEHPVTEAVTGFDLVEWQLLVAAGNPLPVSQADIQLTGHAIEARLYAENVAAGFLPATGTLHRFSLDDTIRVDTGVREGDDIKPFYDPMLAKLIAHAPNRDQALAKLYNALDNSVVLGAITNRAFLAQLCQHPEVVAGQVHTGLIEQDVSVAESILVPVNSPESLFEQQCSCALAALLFANKTTTTNGVFDRIGVWQLWGVPEREVEIVLDEAAGTRTVPFIVRKLTRTQWQVSISPRFEALAENIDTVAQMNHLQGQGMMLELPSLEGRAPDSSQQSSQHKSAERAGEFSAGRVSFNGRLIRSAVEWGGQNTAQNEVDELFVRVGRQERRIARLVIELHDSAGGDAAQLLAPMPGRIIAVRVASGESVLRGALLVTLEAMKMEHSLVAEADNTIDSVPVSVGDQVEQGAVLIRFSAQ